MPLEGDAKKVRKSMEEQYGSKKGEEVFYATANKQKRTPETWKKKDKKKTAQSATDVLQSLIKRSQDARTDPRIQGKSDFTVKGSPPDAGLKPITDTEVKGAPAPTAGPKAPMEQWYQKPMKWWNKLGTPHKWGIGGAASGLALGILSYLLSSKRNKSVLGDIVAPALTGAAGGYGGHYGLQYLRNRMAQGKAKGV